MIKSLLYSALIFWCTLMHAQYGERTQIPDYFLPFDQKALQILKSLPTMKRGLHYKTLQDYPDLQAQRYYQTMPSGEISDEKIFHAAAPTISWKGEASRISCDTVIYADNSAKYLFRKFKELRQSALQILDTENSSSDYNARDDEYNAIIKEIAEILRLVEGAYPLSFFEIDREARYILSPSKVLKGQLLKDAMLRPFGAMTVSHIKFGTDDWIPVHGGIKGIANFVDEPKAKEDERIVLRRDLNPLEACLQNLELSLHGSIPVSRTVSRLILEPLPPWYVPRTDVAPSF